MAQHISSSGFKEERKMLKRSVTIEMIDNTSLGGDNIRKSRTNTVANLDKLKKVKRISQVLEYDSI